MAGLMAFDQGYKNFALVSIKEEPFKVEQAAEVEKVIRIIILLIEFNEMNCIPVSLGN